MAIENPMNTPTAAPDERAAAAAQADASATAMAVPTTAGAFRLTVATLGRELFSGDVRYVEVPGAAGRLGVLKGHTPLITTVAPGRVTLLPAAGALQTIEVQGGIIEIGPWGVTVLADTAARGAEDEARRMAAARQRASVHQPFAVRPIGVEAVKAELDAELVRFFIRIKADSARH